MIGCVWGEGLLCKQQIIKTFAYREDKFIEFNGKHKYLTLLKFKILSKELFTKGLDLCKMDVP